MSKISCWRKINGICVEEKKCSFDSCRVDCATSPDSFCCIDHSLSNRLLQVIGLQPIASTTTNDQNCLTQAQCNSTVCLNCWRFYGQGVNNNAFYELFACGNNPSYFDNGSGLTPMLNGASVAPFGGYEYRRGTATITRVYTDVNSGGGVYTYGSCPQ